MSCFKLQYVVMLDQHHNIPLYSNVVAYPRVGYLCDNFRTGPYSFRVCSMEPGVSARSGRGQLS